MSNKRQTLTAVDDINTDRSSSETNLDLSMQASPRETMCQVTKPVAKQSQSPSSHSSDNENEHVEDEVPKQYQLGKFLSISDVQTPPEKRGKECASEGAKPDVPVQPIKELGMALATNDNSGEEKAVEDDVPKQYQLGKFVRPINSTTTATCTPEEIEDAPIEETSPTTNTSHKQERAESHVPEEEVVFTERDKVQPSNRWFDAYLKCKASRSTQAKTPSAKKPLAKKPLVKKPLAEESSAATPDQGRDKKDDFEKVQKITPSRSYKWREALEKYRALKSDPEQKTEPNSPASEEHTQSSTAPVPVPVKPQQQSAEEPTFPSLAQRAQVFGGIRKKPPLRRTQSFQVGRDHTSPLAMGLEKPTRVLKKQMTSDFS